MDSGSKSQIKDVIAPRVAKGEISLLVGAGFSRENPSPNGKLPDGMALRDLLLGKCSRKAGPSTTLKDAYLLAKKEMSDLQAFLAECFKATGVFTWQERIFQYPWGRIYTTNIDNVLRLAHSRVEKKGKTGGEFSFFNYIDQNITSNSIGSIPVVSIHGTCERLSDGFIFSTLEYARAGLKVLDWHHDLAARIIAGGVVVVGNQLDESDIDSYIVQRQDAYGLEHEQIESKNWIVMPRPDPIKAENYRSAGYLVIDATAEEFFEELYRCVAPVTIGEIVLETVPTVRAAAQKTRAMTWFKSAFDGVLTQIEESKQRKGILRHFLTGADPDWLYISQDVYAGTANVRALTGKITNILSVHERGFAALHVIGPSGSGKTTAIRAALKTVVASYTYVYEFRSESDVDAYLLRDLIVAFTSKSVFIFYSAAAYYYAVNVIAERLGERTSPICLFILEDRLSEYRKSVRQLNDTVTSEVYEMVPLDFLDARAVAVKIDDIGLKLPKFSEKSLDSRARMIQDKEKGFRGDLLSALFSLTTHENFERKIFDEYQTVASSRARSVLDVVAIVNTFGLSLPIDYISGFLGVEIGEVLEILREDLDGMIYIPKGTSSVRCRHRIIAEYYFYECIAGKGSVSLMVGVLAYLSRKFTVDDIRLHPLPYRIYKELISFEFLYEHYFPKATRRQDAEATYHAAQTFFNKDGIFWLHFGRYYRKVGKIDLAIDCFRTGLNFYNSFQTVHSLGTALLHKYSSEGCIDQSLYNEGVQLLEGERQRRGASDPYPTTALIEQLMRIRQKGAHPPGLDDLLKQAINSGLKNFKGDEYFNRALQKYLEQSKADGEQKGLRRQKGTEVKRTGRAGPRGDV
ncbi:ATP-binding protein [Xanthomonas campestris pv. zingibericola]|uniref:ATP-binding protein n=1 Tax=Xanthomonas euvesicatoria TaxID=456327 RepID=UPI001C47B888|nr:ATP-binding protein [Xanthomonas euvesicatoria]MBV6859420.1 ATP-binding protein [Xanthomonas campestris pv. zingibericola]